MLIVVTYAHTSDCINVYWYICILSWCILVHNLLMVLYWSKVMIAPWRQPYHDPRNFSMQVLTRFGIFLQSRTTLLVLIVLFSLAQVFSNEPNTFQSIKKRTSSFLKPKLQISLFFMSKEEILYDSFVQNGIGEIIFIIFLF